MAAAGRWLSGIAAGEKDGRVRVEDPVLLRLGLWTAADIARERGMPIQAHAGFGDPDLDIHQANPALLTGFLRLLDPLDVNVVFLHCWPYHREAGYLAAIYRNAYFDLGAALHYAGPQAIGVMADALEVTPFTKQVFSSGRVRSPELYVRGRRSSGDAGTTLDAWIADDRCSADDAERIALMIGRRTRCGSTRSDERGEGDGPLRAGREDHRRHRATPVLPTGGRRWRGFVPDRGGRAALARSVGHMGCRRPASATGTRR